MCVCSVVWCVWSVLGSSTRWFICTCSDASEKLRDASEKLCNASEKLRDAQSYVMPLRSYVMHKAT